MLPQISSFVITVVLFIVQAVIGSPTIPYGGLSDGSFEKGFEATYRDDGIPLRRRFHRHVYKRDGHNELFEPKNELVLDVLLDDAIQTFTFTHGSAVYVNLELLQVHKLILATTPICSGPDENNKSSIDIFFADYHSYSRAKQHWKSSQDLLFVVEDASCIYGEGTRSIYLAEAIVFQEGVGQPLAVHIIATHKTLALDEPETASQLQLSSQTIKQFEAKHYDTFFLHGRRALTRRDDPFRDIISKFDDELPDPSSILDEVASEFRDAVQDIWEKIEHGLAFSIGVGFSLDLNIPRRPRYQPVQKLQNLGFTPKLTLIDSYGSGTLDVGFNLTFGIMKHDDLEELDGPKEDKINQYVGNYLQSAAIYWSAPEDIKLGLQLEIDLSAGIEWFCSWWLLPVEPWIVFIGCSTAVIVEDFAQMTGESKTNKFDHDSWDDMKKNGGKGKSRHGKAWKSFGMKMLMENGFGIWTRIGATGAVNVTTPGVDVRIPKGAKGEIVFKDGKTTHKNLDSEATWRAPSIELHDSKVYASVAIGPRLLLDAALPGAEKYAFSTSARLDMPKVEFAIGQTHDVNKYCQPAEDSKGAKISDAIGAWVELAAGFYANIVLPFGTVLDTNWLGKRIGPDFHGFMWSRKLIGYCWDEEDPDTRGPKFLTDQLNDKFASMMPKTYSLQNKDDFRNASDEDPESKSPDEHKLQWGGFGEFG